MVANVVTVGSVAQTRNLNVTFAPFPKVPSSYLKKENATLTYPLSPPKPFTHASKLPPPR